MPGIKANQYKSQAYTKFALGPEYALLRPAFLELSKKKRGIKHIKRVFICFVSTVYQNDNHQVQHNQFHLANYKTQIRH